MLKLCIFVLHLTLVVNAMLIEDLQPLFYKKNCIDAELVTLSSSQDASVILDANTAKQQSIMVNITEITKAKYEKSVTMKINELAQYNDITYTYELVAEEGPAHSRHYKVILTLGDETYEGSGSSLKKAQQVAAASALQNTFYEHPPIKLKPEEQSLTPTVVLNNVAMKLGIGVAYSLLTDTEEQAIASYGASDEAYGKSKSYFQKLNKSASFRVPTEEPQISGPFTVRVKVGDSVFTGFGHTIQAARHDAAIKALENFEKQVLYKDNVCSKDDSVKECKEKRDGLKSAISRVYEAGQKRNLAVEFDVISESGKSHQKVFVTRCALGDFVTEGEGNSKKESKRIAAEKMLENLQFLPQITDGKDIINGLSKKKKKKKKNKIVKSNIKQLEQSIGNMLGSFWGASDGHDGHIPATNKVQNEHKSKPGTVTAKDKLLEVGNMLNIEIQFTDLGKKGDDFFALTSLGIHPFHICLGKAITREKSHHSAALHGLKFLYKRGLFEKSDLLQNNKESSNIESGYLEEEDTIERLFQDLEKD